MEEGAYDICGGWASVGSLSICPRQRAMGGKRQSVNQGEKHTHTMHKSTVRTHSFHSMGKPEILGFSHHSLLEQLWGHLWSIPCPSLTPREVHHLQKRLETSEEESPPPPWAAHPSALSPWNEGVLPTAHTKPHGSICLLSWHWWEEAGDAWG